jgi:hypothetical protein
MAYLYPTEKFQKQFDKEDNNVRIKVEKKIDDLKHRRIDLLLEGHMLKCYDRTNGIFVHKFRGSGLNNRLILQELRNPDVPGQRFLVLRDFFLQKEYNTRWENVMLPKVESGAYLEEHPLSQAEKENAWNAYRDFISVEEEVLPALPSELIDWLTEGLMFNPSFTWYESREWAENIQPLLDGYAGEFQRILEDLLDGEAEKTGSGYHLAQLHEKRGLYLLEADRSRNPYIIFEEWTPRGERPIFFLHNLGIKGEEDAAQVTSKKQLALDYPTFKDLGAESDIIPYNYDQWSKGAFRAYEGPVVKDPANWRQIQAHLNKSNIALSPEQLELLRNFDFPCFVNGQAGSGKSEILHNVFAGICFANSALEANHSILFLTENEELLRRSRQEVQSKLIHNSQYAEYKIDTEKIGRYFQPYRRFLLQHFYAEDDTVEALFPLDKYVDFTAFKRWYLTCPLKESTKRALPAELCWFVITTFIKGYESTVEEFTPDAYAQLSRDQKKLVALEIYSRVFEEVWSPYYKKRREEGYWDRLDIVRDILCNYESLPADKKFTVIVCDEAQDFSRLELQLLIKLSAYTDYDLSTIQEVPITFAGDPFQTVNPTGFSLEVTKQLFREELQRELDFQIKGDLSVDLNLNYRSVREVVNLANLIQFVRRNFLGRRDLQNPQTARTVAKAEPPMLFDIDQNGVRVLEKLSDDTVIIVPANAGDEEEWIKSEEVLKPEYTVKSSVRAKGQEFERVALYNFGEQFCREFSEDTLTRLLDNPQRFDQLPAGDQFRIGFFFNKLYVAVTRAMQELFILDTQRGIEAFWQPLKKHPAMQSQMDNAWAVLQPTRAFDPGRVDLLGEKDFQKMLRLAEQEEDSGLRNQDPVQMRDAAKAYARVGGQQYVDKNKTCIAYALLFEGNYERAGDAFTDLKKFDLAGDAYWLGGRWSKLEGLYPANDPRTIGRRLVISFMLESPPKRAEVVAHAEQIKRSLSDPELAEKISWADQFLQVLYTWADAEAQTIGDQQEFSQLARALVKIGYAHDDSCIRFIADLYSQAEEYNYAVDFYEKLPDEYNKPESYYRAKLQVSDTTAERMNLRNRLQDYQGLLREYRNRDEEILDGHTLSLVRKAMARENAWEELLDLTLAHELPWPEYVNSLTNVKIGGLMAALNERVPDLSNADRRHLLSIDFFKALEEGLSRHKQGKKLLRHGLKKNDSKTNQKSDTVVEAFVAYLPHLIALSSHTPSQGLSVFGTFIESIIRTTRNKLTPEECLVLAAALERTQEKYVTILELLDRPRGLIQRAAADELARDFIIQRWWKIELKRTLLDIPSLQKINKETTNRLNKLLRNEADRLASVLSGDISVPDSAALRKLPDLPNLYPLLYATEEPSPSVEPIEVEIAEPTTPASAVADESDTTPDKTDDKNSIAAEAMEEVSVAATNGKTARAEPPLSGEAELLSEFIRMQQLLLERLDRIEQKVE